MLKTTESVKLVSRDYSYVVTFHDDGRRKTTQADLNLSVVIASSVFVQRVMTSYQISTYFFVIQS